MKNNDTQPENSENTPDLDALIEALTLEEKAKLLGGHASHLDPREGDVYGVTGIPLLKFADGPIGVHWWTKASTCYPALIGLAASFDDDTAYRFGCAIGTDCRAVGVHVLLAPGVNIYRSPLCGRNFEYLGEDPELSGALGAAYIRGVQDQGVAATVKHYAANNQEYDRHGISSDVDERTLREVYLRPFEIAVKEGDVACLMTAYNPINGIHASEHKELIEDILRGEWGFEGVVMSDWTSVYSTAQSLNAGLDLEMPWSQFLTHEAIQPLLETGVVSIETINQRIKNRLQVMERFGWLDPDHQQQDTTLPARNLESEAVALDVARNGIVLLKNEEAFLPKTPEEVKTITVIGYHAGKPILCGGGSALCPPHDSITLVDALQQTYGNDVQIDWFQGIALWREDEARTYLTYQTPDGAETGLKAEYFNNNEFKGDPLVTRVDSHPSFDWHETQPDPKLKDTLFSVRWTGQFTLEEGEDFDFYATPNDGVTSVWIDEQPVLLEAFSTIRQSLPLTQGTHQIRIEFKQFKHGWVICHVGFEPTKTAFMDLEEGLQAARDSDLVVVAAGFMSATEGEGHDRTFALDPRVENMICQTAEANANTAVVLYVGGACDVSPWIDQVKSVLCLWYPGQNGTLAAAEILAGKTNPSGKLPFTWEQKLEDRGSFTCYQDDDGDKRVAYSDGIFTGYRHFDRYQIAPRYPFGFGLSYTSFAYENLNLSATAIEPGEPITVQFDVVNTGSVAGSESALLFVGDDESSVQRPVKEFKASQRVSLEPSERTTVSLTLDPRAFAFWDIQESAWAIESGTFTISVGPNAQTLPLIGKISIE